VQPCGALPNRASGLDFARTVWLRCRVCQDRYVLQPERLATLAKAPKSKKRSTASESADEAPVAKPAAASAASSAREPLSKRLPAMTDYQLRAYHESAMRIARDTAHPKSAESKAALPLVEKEISRRATGVAPTPARVGVASPKSDIRKGRGD
jgi:hypothetical protein